MKHDSEPAIETEILHNLVKELEKMNLILERKLLELFLWPKGAAVIHCSVAEELLGDKMTAIGILNGATDSLQDELKNLQEEMRHPRWQRK